MQVLSVLGQAAFFVVGVYLEKFIRKRMFTREKGKEVKQTMRIVTCAVVSMLILCANEQQFCTPRGITFAECFYLRVSYIQILHVIVANSLLFAVHLYEKERANGMLSREINIKNIFIAPLLEELVFRASFLRSSNGHISVFVLALIFSVSHLHRPIRKWVKGKQVNWFGSLFQVMFTLVFGLYSFYFLTTWQSVIPSIILHCYCNYLGPPSIRKDNLYAHLTCIVAVVAYCYFFVS